MHELKDNEDCYVCGPKNSSGLRAAFTIDESAKTLRGSFTARPEHQGYQDIIHGGVIAALLDEAMVKLAWKLGMPAVSAEITVKFKAPARPGDQLSIFAKITGESKRLIEAEAQIMRGMVVIGEAKGKLMRVSG
ncbi:MAG: PaaI family thioesterase [Nitrospiraceae bacterium]|nr:PaaI family thioesterase [Nitrospiraceae bacterium]